MILKEHIHEYAIIKNMSERHSERPQDASDFETQAASLKKELAREDVGIDDLFAPESSTDPTDIELEKKIKRGRELDEQDRPFNQMGYELTNAAHRGELTKDEQIQLGALVLGLGVSEHVESGGKINPEAKKRLIELANQFIERYQGLLKEIDYQEHFGGFESSIQNLKEFVRRLNLVKDESISDANNAVEEETVPVFQEPIMQRLFEEGKIDAEGNSIDPDTQKLVKGLTKEDAEDISKILDDFRKDDPGS